MVVVAATLALEAWIVIAVIAGLTVILCLATLGRLVDYEVEFLRVVGQIKILRAKHFASPDDKGDYVDEVEVAEPMIDQSIELDSSGDDDEMAEVPAQEAA